MSKKPAKSASRRAQKLKRRTTPQRGAKAAARPAGGTETAERIAAALETIATHLAATAPAQAGDDALNQADAFIWHPDGRLAPVPHVSRVDIGLLKGIERMRDILIENTERFANGLPANNALLWLSLIHI